MILRDSLLYRWWSNAGQMLINFCKHLFGVDYIILHRSLKCLLLNSSSKEFMVISLFDSPVFYKFAEITVCM